MRTPLLALFAALTLASGAAGAKTLTIGLDVSASAPLLKSDIYADLAAKRAAVMIRSLSLGDTVIVRPFGARTLANLKTLRIQVNRRARAGAVADAIAGLIRHIPHAGIAGQPWTNIVSFLSFGDFGCAAGGQVLLITDGIESTPQLNEKHLLAGTASLPAADAGSLAGCSVTMFGIGASAGGAYPVSQIKTLRAAWAAWMKHAGAEFDPVILQ